MHVIGMPRLRIVKDYLSVCRTTSLQTASRIVKVTKAAVRNLKAIVSSTLKHAKPNCKDTAAVIKALSVGCGIKVVRELQSSMESDSTRVDSGSAASTSGGGNAEADSSVDARLAADIVENLIAACRKGNGTTTSEMCYVVNLIRAVVSGTFEGGKKLSIQKCAKLFGNHKNTWYNALKRFSRQSDAEILQGMEQERSEQRKEVVTFRTWDKLNYTQGRLARGALRAENSNQLKEEVKSAVLAFWTDSRWTVESPCKKDQVLVAINGIKTKVRATLRFFALSFATARALQLGWIMTVTFYIIVKRSDLSRLRASGRCSGRGLLLLPSAPNLPSSFVVHIRYQSVSTRVA